MTTTLLDVAKLADAFFMEKSPIHQAMRPLARTLRDMNISFVIVGAMAANAHGHKRTTADVNVLLRREDLQRFRAQWIGRGWVEKFAGSRGFRDTVSNVNIDVLITGDYPGDGQPKPVAFPAPEAVAELHGEDIPYVSLRALLELKLASGMTAAHRLQDLADVIALIRANNLSLDYAESLNPYVREKFRLLWEAAQVQDDY